MNDSDILEEEEKTRVAGCYYGKDFTGIIDHKAPNWENGSFKQSEGVHLRVILDQPIEHFGRRDSLWFPSWVSKQMFHWGHCEVLA